MNNCMVFFSSVQTILFLTIVTRNYFCYWFSISYCVLGLLMLILVISMLLSHIFFFRERSYRVYLLCVGFLSPVNTLWRMLISSRPLLYTTWLNMLNFLLRGNKSRRILCDLNLQRMFHHILYLQQFSHDGRDWCRPARVRRRRAVGRPVRRGAGLTKKCAIQCSQGDALASSLATGSEVELERRRESKEDNLEKKGRGQSEARRGHRRRYNSGQATNIQDCGGATNVLPRS